MLHILEHSVIDSLKILPFLFVTYLIIEYIVHRSSGKILNGLKNYGVAGGAFLGSLPQCGFSVAAANLYNSRLITTGTLISVFISTSDEAIPVLLANSGSFGTVGKLLLIKIILAIIAGFIADRVFSGFFNNDGTDYKEYLNTVHSHHCDHGLIMPALKHTAKTYVYILITMFIMELAIDIVGEERLSILLMSNTVIQPFITGLVGFIPNCASSIILTQLYLSGSISFGAAVAGLSTGAGVGLIVLFRTRKNIKENIKIMLFTYIFSVIAGSLIQLVA
ncbi:putative manganese transporter [Sedimentibacter sp.]|uniref:putative manganese transporter n=1 Tax=Sedimentibacter sp. TaxID=1960295 RepID=UPI002897ACD7|nr:putative manganese transporter [Sedimentibacter sp.]